MIKRGYAANIPAALGGVNAAVLPLAGNDADHPEDASANA